MREAGQATLENFKFEKIISIYKALINYQKELNT